MSRLFIPDELRDSKIADSLINYYGKYFDMQILEDAIRLFVKETHEPITLYAFAMKSHDFRDKVLHEKKLKDDFDRTLRETRERMRELEN